MRWLDLENFFLEFVFIRIPENMERLKFFDPGLLIFVSIPNNIDFFYK